MSCPTCTRSGRPADSLRVPSRRDGSSPPAPAPATAPAVRASSAAAPNAASRRRAAGSLLRREPCLLLGPAPLHRRPDLLDRRRRALLHALQVPAGERDQPHGALGDDRGAAAVLLEQAHLAEVVA